MSKMITTVMFGPGVATREVYGLAEDMRDLHYHLDAARIAPNKIRVHASKRHVVEALTGLNAMVPTKITTRPAPSSLPNKIDQRLAALSRTVERVNLGVRYQTGPRHGQQLAMCGRGARR